MNMFWTNPSELRSHRTQKVKFIGSLLMFFPNQACLWGSYSKERISVGVVRVGGSPIMQGPVPPKILVPRSTESPRGGASRYAGGHGGLQAPRQGVWGAGSPPVRTTLWTQNQDFGTRIWYFWVKNIKVGLKWVHMARYELILRLDGALWLRIIFKPLLTPKRVIKNHK